MMPWAMVIIGVANMVFWRGTILEAVGLALLACGTWMLVSGYRIQTNGKFALIAPKRAVFRQLFADPAKTPASCDTRRMAETGNTDSVRSTGGAVGEAETPKG